jgi:hypothetical protein
MQQCRMPGRVGDVEPAGHDRHGDSIGSQRGAVSRAVDAVGAAGDDRDVAFRQSGGQVARRVLAVACMSCV